MTSYVTRLYPSQDKAAAAARALREQRFGERRISIAGPGRDAVLAALRHAGITGERAEAALARAGAGATALTVEAQFGTAGLVERVLGKHDSVDYGHSRAVYRKADNPSPLSDALGMRVLSHNPAPLSAMFGLPPLSAKQNPDIQLSHESAPFSKALGMAVLSSKQNPDIKLSHEAAPFSKALGMRVLSAKQNPDVTLSHDPAPLSHGLGLPVLTREQ